MSAAEQGAHQAFRSLNDAANELIIGQHRLMERLLIALLSNGHLLVEGAPGLAKTTAIHVLAARAEKVELQLIRFGFSRQALPPSVWRFCKRGKRPAIGFTLMPLVMQRRLWLMGNSAVVAGPTPLI